jgi:glutathione S-transferase
LPSLQPLLAWMDRVAAIGHGSPREMSAAEALAVAGARTPAQPGNDPAAGLGPGAEVSVTPDDAGRDPATGRLVAVTAHEVILHRQDERLGDVNVHFPRAGFDVERA